ncbi:MAG TPA: CoA transferase [Chloroflexota bacterium]|nr:CoA transferase [Chloroflexota bacterium]
MIAPLAGIRVLELANFMSGPFCGMQLADMGADVIKVEPPSTGDNARLNVPHLPGGDGAGFHALNRNKRSLALNLKTPEGKQIFRRLARTADVVLENFRPGTMDDLELGDTTLRSENPRLIYCAISGFGQTGPYRERAGLDLIAQGMSGLMSITGEPEGAPVKVGIPVSDLATALYAAYAIVCALWEREKTGEGRVLDLSLFETDLALEVWETAEYFANGKNPGKLGSAHRSSAPYQAFRTRDSYVTLGAGAPRLWKSTCEVLERPDLFEDPRFVDLTARKRNEAELAAIIEEILMQDDSQVWVERFDRAGVPCGILNTVPQALNDPHTTARGILKEVDHPKAGRVKLVGSPVHISGETLPVGRPAPMLGEHAVEILSSLNISRDEIDRLLEKHVIEMKA